MKHMGMIQNPPKLILGLGSVIEFSLFIYFFGGCAIRQSQAHSEQSYADVFSFFLRRLMVWRNPKSDFFYTDTDRFGIIKNKLVYLLCKCITFE